MLLLLAQGVDTTNRDALKINQTTRGLLRFNPSAFMTPRRVTVECYAGQRADERPGRVTIDEREHVITRLIAESVEESLVTKGRTRRYKVLTDEGLVLEILRTSDGAWYLESQLPANQTGQA